MPLVAYKYKKEFCDLLVKHMASGLSFDSFAAITNTTAKCLYDWISRYPDFEDAKLAGEAKSLLFWEKVGRKGIMGGIKGFQATPYVFTMKARFKKYGWVDEGYLLPAQRQQSSEQASALLEKLTNMVREKECLPTKPSTVSPQVSSPSGLLGASSKQESKP